MKKTLLLMVALFFGVSTIFAQTKQISGKVTSAEDGTPIPGVSVVVKGTTNGTTTNFDGEFTFMVPENETLVFSFVGMKPKEVPITSATVYNVVLETESIGVGEVVVTAMGIRREKKALGYSVSEFSADDFGNVGNDDATKALQGKVAGVSISAGSGAPGAATRVIVRGLSSITGSNQPLYVVDGVPINNSFASGNATENSMNVNAKVDFGNSAADINPADIETISVLKGAAASNLYGSRAANGVIMITTKKGSKNNKLQVNFSSSSAFTEVGRLPYFQTRFGQGWSGTYDSKENGSWGPVLDGKDRLTGYVVDNVQQVAPFTYKKNGIRDVYEYGYSLNNTIALSGGNDFMGWYASATNSTNDGVLPGDVDVLDRNTLTFKANGGTDKTKLNFGMTYINRAQKTIPTGQGDDAGTGAVIYSDILYQPINHYLPDYRNYKYVFNNLDNYYNGYAQNPYFTLNETGATADQNRIIANLNITQELLKGLSISFTGGADTYSQFSKVHGAVAKVTPGSNNSGTINDVAGAVKEEARYLTQLNSDLVINYNNEVEIFGGNLRYNVLFGNNINQRSFKRDNIISKGLVVPGYYNVGNISGSAEVYTSEYKRRLVGVFGQLGLEFNDYLFINLQARNDWSSTLPIGNNSFFYPGATLGFIFTDLLPDNKNFSYGKLRLSYALAGNDAAPFMTSEIYRPSILRAGGFGFTNYPVGGIPAYEKHQRLGNPNLKPEISKELEIGTDLRFLSNRIGVDFAYYKKTTTDLIMLANIAASTGYREITSNLGQITNDGIELAINITPVKTTNFTWDFTYLFNKANMVLDELSEELGVSEYLINDAYETEFVAIPGEQLGMYRIPDYKYSPDGKIIVGDNGLPVEGDKKLVGSSVPDFMMSFTNNLSYKGFRFSFLIDYQKGGLMYSNTANATYWSGNNEQSTTNDRRPWIIPNTVTEIKDAEGNVTGYTENTTPVVDNWHDYYSSNTNKPFESSRLISRTFIKLREVSLSYRFSGSLLNKTFLSSANVSLFGRNLFLWTPKDNSYVDPETTTWDNDIQGLFGEFNGAPSVRTYGLKLDLTF
ncbi:SusC/RagA family TonB-linked outer membrane protein [Maribellus sp. CM-23]|uniref:SusC/RagA family TonB-linked outer membrane protein n=1 Tax=Maribellus sp. CM-23 TaxID=2781026 RepID=UPI001F319AA2|nr:SusC/RagA family TonB-linked outer membrane protein [Maribellus sp. CM-23]MCE4563115.1 SusC/RagA family TonB-linked outer membrane protein [Maribellus sp. CM-23]